MKLKNKQIDFYDTLEEVLFVDFIKQNNKYENGVKTEEIDSFSIRCFSVKQRDCFVLKITDMAYLNFINELKMFERLDIQNGVITEFKSNFYFKCSGVRAYE